MFDSIQKILVTRLRFMGDVILTTPLIRNLRQHFPKAYIAYLTEERFVPLLQNNPYLDEIIPFYPQANILQQLHLISTLRKKSFDLTLDLLGSPRTAILLWLTGAPHRIGRPFRFRRMFYNHLISGENRKVTAVEFHLESLKPLGVNFENRPPMIFLAMEEKIWAENYLNRLGINSNKPLFGLHPGGSWPNKLWPVERFAELAQKILAAGGQVLLTHGPGEDWLVRKIVAHTSSAIWSTGVLPLRKLAALLSKLDVYVTNDCGPMHLAAAVGTRTFGIFGPGEPEIWFPYESTSGHRAILQEIECRPCHKNYCPLGTLECMDRIEVEAVFKYVQDSLDKEIKIETNG
jgi:lipopolysaccharide heptosyltransferase II